MVDKNDRNWLIRTRAMQILGPVSIGKVLELIEKGSLRDEDEVSSGNGYWFCLREKELVERYLEQKNTQGFNPISEAKTVLAKVSEPVVVKKPETVAVPVAEEAAPLAAEDLEYPDMGEIASPAAQSIEIEPAIEVPALEEVEVEDDEEFEDDDDDDDGIEEALAQEEFVEEIIEEEEEEEVPEAPPTPMPKKKTKNSKNTKKKKSDRYLFVLLILVGFLVVGIVYYYRTIINKPLPGFESSFFMNSAYAQSGVITAPGKKKA